MQGVWPGGPSMLPRHPVSGGWQLRRRDLHGLRCETQHLQPCDDRDRSVRTVRFAHPNLLERLRMGNLGQLHRRRPVRSGPNRYPAMWKLRYENAQLRQQLSVEFLQRMHRRRGVFSRGDVDDGLRLGLPGAQMHAGMHVGGDMLWLHVRHH